MRTRSVRSLVLVARGTAMLLATLAAPVAAQTAPAPAPAAAPAPKAAAPVLSGLAQIWYTNATGPAVSSFRIRRLEVNVNGQAAPRVKYAVKVDFAKALTASNGASAPAINQAGRALQDAYLSIAVAKHLTIDAGQFTLPFTYTGSQAQSSSRLETVERPLFATTGALTLVRDIGVAAKAAVGPRMDAIVAVTNGLGESQNTTDKTEQKFLSARVVARPLAAHPGFHVGVSGVYDGAPDVAVATRRARGGAEVQAVGARSVVRAEAVIARDGAIHRRGGYVLGMVRPCADHDAVELVGRVEHWIPDTKARTVAATAPEQAVTVGATYRLGAPHTKLQLNVVERRTRDDLRPRVREVLLGLQATF